MQGAFSSVFSRTEAPEEEGDICFASNSPGKQGLAGARGPCEKDTLRQLGAQACELCWVLQVLHDLLKLCFGLITALHIPEALDGFFWQLSLHLADEVSAGRSLAQGSC